MSIFRAIYSSRPFGFDAGVLHGILEQARRLNQRDGITGALICRDDIYLQWLEGPEDKVRSAIDRISRDDRHLEVTLHVTEPAEERLFADWAMLHDPAASWIWSRAELADNAIDRATPEEVTGFFLRLRDSAEARASD
jgi:hypothetical protein